jgi:hypothetical protein
LSITTTGYDLKRYQDIIAEVQSDFITATGNPNFDMSDDSLIGILNRIWCLKVSELYELAAAQWSAGDPDTATGVALERIVRRARMTRLQAVKAYGTLEFTGTLGANINLGTQVKDLAGNVVQTLSQLTLNSTTLKAVNINITVANNFTYSLSVNGVVYSVISDATATEAEIISLFQTALSSLTTISVSNNANRLQLTSQTDFSVSVSTNLAIFNVTNSVASEALLANTEDYEANTLNYLVTTLPSITVTNNQKWVTGRAEETDAELRSRFYGSVGGQGRATVNAIFAALTSTEGVVSAVVEENWTNTTNVNGLPAKSIECTVKGGSDLAVANTIWNTKPAGIQPFGNTSTNIVDSQNQTQTIFYSRPVDQYIHVRVEYQLYSEELFPSDGAVQIANAVKAYGDSLGLNEDVIPQRIMGAIYSKVSGISNLAVTAGKTLTPTDSPILSSGITTIGRKDEAVFDISRITVVAG